MAAIPGWVYLGMGVVMVISSLLIRDKTTGARPLLLFFFIGIIFILIGIGKYSFKSRTNQAENEPVYEGVTQSQARHRQSHRMSQSARQQKNAGFEQASIHMPRGQHNIEKVTEPVQHQSIIACPMCGTRHYDYARFCMKCGSRIKLR